MHDSTMERDTGLTSSLLNVTSSAWNSKKDKGSTMMLAVYTVGKNACLGMTTQGVDL